VIVKPYSFLGSLFGLQKVQYQGGNFLGSIHAISKFLLPTPLSRLADDIFVILDIAGQRDSLRLVFVPKR
jgi:hypothetical protein